MDDKILQVIMTLDYEMFTDECLFELLAGAKRETMRREREKHTDEIKKSTSNIPETRRAK